MQVEAACRAFLAGELSNDELCRAVVRHPTWQLLVNDQNCPSFWEIGDKNRIVALTENRPVNGVTAKAVTLSGRELVRSISDDAQGIAFELGTDHAVSFSRAEIDGDLLHYASAIDCEQTLQTPLDPTAHQLASHCRLLLMDDDRPFMDESSGAALAYAFTTPDALGVWRRQRPALDWLTSARLPGAEMFARVAAMDEVDGLQINPELQDVEPLSPFVLQSLANDVDNRFDVRILPARTIAEIHTFLDQMQVYRVSIEHEMTYRDDALVARYHGVAKGGRPVSFDFTPVTPTDDPLHIGVHKSELLCPGWLASQLARAAAKLPADVSSLTDDDIVLLENAMRWIAQLWALLDDRPAFARTELLTVAGAATARKHPTIITLDWVNNVFSDLVRLERERNETVTQTS